MLLSEAFRLVEDGYVTPQDLDKTLKDGLGLRWSFMGPFETIELNAPGGIADYCVRYTGFYCRLQSAPAGAAVYGDDNVARILPDGKRAVIRRGSWPVPPVFDWLKKLGNVPQAEMDRVFNGGIGFAVVAAPFYAESIREQLTRDGFPAHRIGDIRDGEPGVEWV